MNNDGSTPLHLAAKQNNVAVLQLLVASGTVDLLAKDAEGNTPIQLCEKGGECFELLRGKLLEMKRARDSSNLTAASAVAQPTASAATSTGVDSIRGAEQLEKMTKAIALLTNNIDVERARVAELESRLAQETLRSSELLQKGGLSLCVKCQSRMRDRVFLPCMHLHYCGECAKSMTSCESCNVQLMGKVPAKLE
jgi:hypothetical protein